VVCLRSRRKPLRKPVAIAAMFFRNACGTIMMTRGRNVAAKVRRERGSGASSASHTNARRGPGGARRRNSRRARLELVRPYDEELVCRGRHAALGADRGTQAWSNTVTPSAEGGLIAGSRQRNDRTRPRPSGAVFGRGPSGGKEMEQSFAAEAVRSEVPGR